MQTKPETEVGQISGARQVPLLTRDQIVPGVMFTGIAADHVHEVVAVNGDVMTVQRLPRVEQPANHTHAFTQHGNTTCACGLGQRPIAVLLPESATTPRAHLLVPIGAIQVPDDLSVYVMLGASGRLDLLHNEVPRREVPIVARATKVWGLPEAAVRMIRDYEGQSRRTEVRGIED